MGGRSTCDTRIEAVTPVPLRGMECTWNTPPHISEVCRNNARPKPMGFWRCALVDVFLARMSRNVFLSIPHPLSRTRITSQSRLVFSITVMRNAVAPAASEFMPMSRMFSESWSNIFLQLLLAEPDDLIRRELAVDIGADGDGWCQRARPDAARGLETEQTVFGRLALFDAQLLAKTLDHCCRAAHVTRCARANHDLVLAARDDGEEIVKRRHAIHVRQR